jgi:hypothetical protein
MVKYYFTVANPNNSGASGITSLAANLASVLLSSGQLNGAHAAPSALTSAAEGDGSLAGTINYPQQHQWHKQRTESLFKHCIF